MLRHRQKIEDKEIFLKEAGGKKNNSSVSSKDNIIFDFSESTQTRREGSEIHTVLRKKNPTS